MLVLLPARIFVLFRKDWERKSTSKYPGWTLESVCAKINQDLLNEAIAHHETIVKEGKVRRLCRFVSSGCRLLLFSG